MQVLTDKPIIQWNLDQVMSDKSDNSEVLLGGSYQLSDNVWCQFDQCGVRYVITCPKRVTT